MQTCLDSNNQEIRAKSNQADDFAIKLQNEILFFELKLARISPEKQSEEFYQSFILAPYHQNFQKNNLHHQNIYFLQSEKNEFEFAF